MAIFCQVKIFCVFCTFFNVVLKSRQSVFLWVVDRIKPKSYCFYTSSAKRTLPKCACSVKANNAGLASQVSRKCKLATAITNEHTVCFINLIKLSKPTLQTGTYTWSHWTGPSCFHGKSSVEHSHSQHSVEWSKSSANHSSTHFESLCFFLIKLIGNF